MSLYDRYQQSNSTIIPQYEGSNGEDFVKVGEYRQGQYDTAREAGNEIGDASGNLNVSGSGLAGVDAAADDLRSEVSGKIQQLTDKGDWENAIPDVKALGRHFANRSAEIMTPINALATYKKGLDEKELNLTPDQKAGLVGISVDAYNKSGGLQKNPRGQYQGTSIGVAAAKNIDVNKKVDEWMKDFATHKGGTDIERDPADGALWIVKNGVKTEKLSPDEIKAHIATAAKNDNEFQAYQQQEGALAGYKFKGVDPSQLQDGVFKQTAMGVQQKYPGLKFSDALNKDRQSEVLGNAMAYALKYKKDDRFTERAIKMDEWTKYLDEKADRLAKTKADYESMSPFMGQGANTKMNLGQPDYDKAISGTAGTQGNIKQNEDNIATMRKQLGDPKLDPAARTQLETNIAAATNENTVLQDGLNKANKVQTQAQIDAAQAMHYKDYNDFVQNGTKPIDKLISDNMGDRFSHFNTTGGRVVTRQDIKEAIATGRAKVTHFDPVNSYGLPGGTIQKASVSGVQITLKDGTQLTVPNDKGGEKLGNAIEQMQSDNSSTLAQFNKKVKAAYTDNVSNLSIQSTDVDIPSAPMREALTRQLRSHTDGTIYTMPGQISPEKAPDNFRVVGISTAGGNGTRTKIEALDTDGKPFSPAKYMDAITTNDNYSENVGRILATSEAPEAQMGASLFTKGSPAQQIQQMSPGETIPVPTGTTGSVRENAINGVKSLNISMNKDPKSGKLVYNLIEPDGHIKDTKSTAAEAALWITGGLPAHVNPKSYVNRPRP